MKVEYSANNSGGSWWLKDKDWKALERAGWEVQWGGPYYCSPSSGFPRPEGKPDCGRGKECHGHRKFNSFDEVKDNRWLGAAAKEATKEFDSIAEAIREFEKVTHQDASAEGCNCCGAPHTFHWQDGDHHEYASGEDVLPLLYGDGPKTLREAYRALKEKP